VRIILGQDEAVGRFAADRLGIPLEPPFTSMGIIDDISGELVGAIIYNRYNKYDIEISFYGPGAMHRRFIKAAFEYPFTQLGVLRLTARTKRSNKVMCKLLPRLGFIYEATLKNHFGQTRGDDAVLYRLTRSEAARWIGE